MFNQFTFQAVDGIQSAKKQFVSSFIQHDGFQKVLNNFVDAQTEYTKSAIVAGTEVITKTGEILTDRTPYVKFLEKVAEYFPMTHCATKKAK